MIPAKVLVALDLAPRDAERSDERAGKALVLVREQQFAAFAAELAVVAGSSPERVHMPTGAAPLLDEACRVLCEGHPERLVEAGHRAMKAVAEREAEREVAVFWQIDFGSQRDVAVRRRGELPIQLEILIQVLPPVALADIAAGASHERHVGS